MGQLWKKLHTRRYQAMLPTGVDYQLAFDNAGVHQGANLRQYGINSSDIVDVPALSSDLQKVVEHCHANLYNAMQKWLQAPQQQSRKKLPVEECMAQLLTTFRGMKEQIQKDVDSLPATYQEIIDREGGYVSKSNR
jgi:hypothetical protein